MPPFFCLPSYLLFFSLKEKSGDDKLQDLVCLPQLASELRHDVSGGAAHSSQLSDGFPESQGELAVLGISYPGVIGMLLVDFCFPSAFFSPFSIRISSGKLIMKGESSYFAFNIRDIEPKEYLFFVNFKCHLSNPFSLNKENYFNSLAVYNLLNPEVLLCTYIKIIELCFLAAWINPTINA